MSLRRDELVVRTVGVLGMAWGALLLGCGGRIWRKVDGEPPTVLDDVATRVLGGRHLVQGAAEALAPGHLRRTYAGVDLLHAATMVALARSDRDRRRAATVSAAVALGSAVTLLAAEALR